MVHELDKKHRHELSHLVVHTLLFACPDCGLLIAIARVSDPKAPEHVDGESLRVTCSYCEKASKVPVGTAKKHYIDGWEYGP